MKKKINVIDLDKTLIPYDSFRLLIENELKSFNLYVGIITFLRLLKIINSNKHKEIISKYLYRKKDNVFFIHFADKIYNDIDTIVLTKVKNKTDVNTINVLISNSPNIYVQFIIDKLGWKGSGSYFDENMKFISLYSDEKIKWLKQNFNQINYNYNFAISDSKSDLKLLSLFCDHILWNSQ